MSSSFYYFGFGSNMLAQRLQLKNTTAKRIGVGLLKGYRLDFASTSKKWQGSPATIVPTGASHVYGSIWQIDKFNLKDLDDQEGVSSGIYIPFEVSILSLLTNESITCRSYHLAKQPITDLRTLGNKFLPYDRQPSQTYLKVIVKGAVETGIPEDYVKWLRGIKHNGQLVAEYEDLFKLTEVQL